MDYDLLGLKNRTIEADTTTESIKPSAPFTRIVIAAIYHYWRTLWIHDICVKECDFPPTPFLSCCNGYPDTYKVTIKCGVR